MTNKEILQADLLDILFEHRNKLYGAYALRKTYTRRLGLALGVALSLILLFLMVSFIKKNNNEDINRQHDDVVKLTQLVIPEDEPEEPEPIKEKSKPQGEPDYQKPVVVPDIEADPNIVENEDLESTYIWTSIIEFIFCQRGLHCHV